MTDLEQAERLLRQRECTCVLVRGKTVYESRDRGIGPLMQWLESGTDCSGFSAADKVVGRATAFLYARLGIKAVWAQTMSAGAVAVLDAMHIPHSCETQVEAILNRKKDGFCPMESAVRSVEDPDEAFRILSEKYHSMNR